MLGVTLLLAAVAARAPEQRVFVLQRYGYKFALKERRMLYLLAFLPMLIISGFRYMVGVDYNSYAWIFSAITKSGEKTHVEAGYELLNKLWGFFSDDFVGVFVLSSIVILLFFAAAIYGESENRLLSIFLFITLGYFFYSMNSVRHFMALSIFFFATRYMKTVSVKNFIKFAILILIAASFHKIALICIPIYFVFTTRFSLKYYAIFAVILAVCAVFNQQLMNIIFSFVYSAYRGSVYNVYDFSLFNVLLCGVASFFGFVYYRPLLEKDKSNIIYINAAFFMLLFYLTCWWIPTPTRIGHFGTVFFILLFPKALACEENPRTRHFLTAALVIFSILFMLIMLDGAKDPSVGLMPYRSVLDR